MEFNLKQTAIYKALRIGKSPFIRFNKFLKILFFALLLILFYLFITGISAGNLDEKILKQILGGITLSFAIEIFLYEIYAFFKLKVKKPDFNKLNLESFFSKSSFQAKDFNLANFLDYEAAFVCAKALNLSRKKKFQGLPLEVLLYFVSISNSEEIKFIFGRSQIKRQYLIRALKKEFLKIEPGENYNYKNFFLKAAKISQRRNKKRIGIGDVLIAFSENNEFFKRFLTLQDLDNKDIENVADWYEKIKTKIAKSKRFWDYENLIKKSPIGKDWAAGYTVVLDKYSADLEEKIRKNKIKEIIGHKKEIQEIERILEKSEINNVLLVGEPGAGRKSIVEAISRRAFLGESGPNLKHKRFLSFNPISISAQTASYEKTAAILDQCFAEAVRAGNVVLVIEEFQTLMVETAGKNESSNNANMAGILARYLPLSSFQIIAIANYQDLHRIIERNQAIMGSFEKVEVSEISDGETLKILENYVPFFENKSKKFISYNALMEIIKLSSRYLSQVPFPEKAIRLLDETITHLRLYGKDLILSPRHIRKIVSEKTGMPLEKLEEKEKEILLNMENLIHRQIINQNEAVKDVSNALRRARAQIQVKHGPFGSFLFLGPTGVGKTETAKALAKNYFGGEKNIIRLDMSEFQNSADTKRLIGSGEKNLQGLLTMSVRENPFSLILLDEIEKAHPNILNLFLQVLDEGWITDGFGRKINFKGTIIIATSNAGAELIREDITKDKKLDIVKQDLLDYIFKKRIFSPELINRFDGVVVFKPLSQENLLAISQLMLNKLQDNLKDKGITFKITEELKKAIVNLSFSPAFGAREMKRTIQNKVENALAQALLSGKLKRGNKAKVDPKDFSLIISK